MGEWHFIFHDSPQSQGVRYRFVFKVHDDIATNFTTAENNLFIGSRKHQKLRYLIVILQDLVVAHKYPSRATPQARLTLKTWLAGVTVEYKTCLAQHKL